ncbi:hypothetical protein X797_007645 [Metarhizium robertsii]|uniref:Uncharacterized protein n=1 Tax=Metarhizium robertsii TaxID=568076 RepID=A0A014NC52_9HYPO|nr:hypothetical protein X797_007645 [Metarhizium robertsii]
MRIIEALFPWTPGPAIFGPNRSNTHRHIVFAVLRTSRFKVYVSIARGKDQVLGLDTAVYGMGYTTEVQSDVVKIRSV